MVGDGCKGQKNDARRPGIGEAVMHTDRGAQYTSHDFRDRCLANGVIPSVGRTGT